MLSGAPKTNNRVEIPIIMRALDPEVGDAIWAAVEALPPKRFDAHPLGCHRPRASDRACFNVMLVRLATGCSWEDAERLTGRVVSDTTARNRRSEWVDAGVFDAIAAEAIAGYDNIIGLDSAECAVDGSLHKSPCGGEGTGKSPTDRAKLGWKWSIDTDRYGIPIGWTAKCANRNDSILHAPTRDDVAKRGLLVDIETLWLDRGYDSNVTRTRLVERGIDDAVIAKRRKRTPGVPTATKKQPTGLRWPVERTNSSLSNYGQMRGTTDRKQDHRLAQLALVVSFILTAKLIDWRNRWSRDLSPVR